jgi:ABC-type glycerol-3-phosphate transport system substrate-binding protein
MHSKRLPTTVIPVLVAALASGGLTACSSKSASDQGTVTITVMGQPPTSDAANRQLFLDDIARFEKENPGIKVKPSDVAWQPQTFAARLAGGNAETVLQVPLTEPPGLIARHQVLDLTGELAKWPQYSAYDQRLIAPNKDASGKVYGLTYTQYTLGLVYNRALFLKAGLDPDKPPTTWDEVRASAKAIHDKTGAIGLAETTTKNTGGWHLTAETYSRAGTMETDQNGKQVAAFNDQPTKDALRFLHDMRWVDNSMGGNDLLSQVDVMRKFGAGQVGMYVDGPGAVVPIVGQYGGNKDDFGAGGLPQAGGNTTLLGGTVGLVTAKASKAQVAAAVKWILFEYIKPLYDPTIAAGVAQNKAKDPKVLVGTFDIPAFNQEIQDKVNAAVKPYVNVPMRNYQPYLDGNTHQKFLPEPSVDAQKLYAALDPVVQAVLTQKDANIDSLLSKAADDVNANLKKAQQ